jgi:hypothetical protein
MNTPVDPPGQQEATAPHLCGAHVGKPVADDGVMAAGTQETQETQETVVQHEPVHRVYMGFGDGVTSWSDPIAAINWCHASLDPNSYSFEHSTTVSGECLWVFRFHCPDIAARFTLSCT